MLNIDLKQLQFVTERLFSHVIETRGENVISIDENYYWNIPIEELFNMKSEPKDFDVGSLHDDWEFLSSLLEVDSDSAPLARQLEYLSVILRYIANKLGDKFAPYGG